VYVETLAPAYGSADCREVSAPTIPTADTQAGRYLDALRMGEFRAVFVAYVISMLGDVIAMVALAVLVYQRTGSALLAALVFTCAFVPFLLGGTLLSGLVDRIEPRRLLVGADLISACLVGTMALPGVPTGALLALLAVTNLLPALSTGVRSALLPEMMPGELYIPARSLLRIVAQGSQVIGNGVAGLFLLLVSARWALALDAVTFLGSAALLRWGMRRRHLTESVASRVAGLGRDSLDGIRSVLGDPGIRRVLLLTWLIATFSVAPEALGVAYVHDIGASASAVGWWLAMLPAGVVIGELAAVRVLPARIRRRTVRPLAAWCFVPLLLLGLQPPLGIALPLLVLSGLGSAYTLGLDLIGLEVTPEPLLARMFTIATAGLMTLQGLGFAAAGALGQFVSPSLAIVIAACCGLAVVALLRLPAVTRASESASPSVPTATPVPEAAAP
jgi:MFS family permease